MEAWINDYVGVPFKGFGRTPAAWDCWGVIYHIYKTHFGIEVPTYRSDYSNAEDLEEVNQLTRQERGRWNKIDAGDERFGDVVLCRSGDAFCHVGLVVERPNMLHVERGITTIVESYTGLLWKNRIVGFYRHDQRM